MFNNKQLNRLEQMIEYAINNEPISEKFDESRLSSIESKFLKFIKIKQLESESLNIEHRQVHSLIADISHQTKTPVANLKLYGEMLAETDLNPDQAEKLYAMQSQIDKLQFLTETLVLGARLEADIIKVHPVRQPICRLLDNVLHESLPKARNKSITLNVAPCDIQCTYDLKWTSEALFNLLDNAIKYSRENSTINISVKTSDMYGTIVVQDFGIGFEQSELNLLFKRFYRGKNVSNIDGLGIGLYLSREIISKQKGYIIASNNQPSGSQFAVYLPK